jgi:hypothetical protein
MRVGWRAVGGGTVAGGARGRQKRHSATRPQAGRSACKQQGDRGQYNSGRGTAGVAAAGRVSGATKPHSATGDGLCRARASKWGARGPGNTDGCAAARLVRVGARKSELSSQRRNGCTWGRVRHASAGRRAHQRSATGRLATRTLSEISCAPTFQLCAPALGSCRRGCHAPAAPRSIACQSRACGGGGVRVLLVIPRARAVVDEPLRRLC